MPEENLLKDEILSPEGVEEKLLESRTYEITLTGGGKFRTYYTEKRMGRRIGTGCYDTLKEAQHNAAVQMNMQSALVLKPDVVIGFLFEQITGRTPPKHDDDD